MPLLAWGKIVEVYEEVIDTLEPITERAGTEETACVRQSD